jgi:hypothetical protein
MQATTQTAETKAAAVPDGLHSVEGVEYLAKVAGFEGEHLPSICIFGEEMGFSEVTAFIRSGNGRGYYRTTLKTCTCPSFKFRGGLCKHQKRLAEALHKRGDRLPAAAELAIGRPEQLPYPAKPGARWEPRKMTAEELATRKARIDERNRQRAEERARAPRPSTSSKGFHLPEEVRA